ncbi:MAG: nitroreductase family protein [Clostridiales bacterium]|nr:nitroreductase family protein [Clostridiales bacterium]
MEDILNTIVSRRSVKKYKETMPSDEEINKVIKAGIYAPSGKNKQAPIILAIKNKQIRDDLSKILADFRGVDRDPFYGAPVVLVVLADKSVSTHVYDGSVVIENMLLECHSIGLGACWIHHAKEIFETSYGKNLLKSLGIDGEYEGIGSCILGYSDVELNTPIPRKDNYVYYVD